MSATTPRWPTNCARIGCPNLSDCVLGIAFFKAGEEDGPERQWIVRVVMGVHVCEKDIPDAVERGPAAFLGPEALEHLSRLAERQKACRIDRQATRIVRVGYDDPDWLAFDQMRARQASAHLN